MPELPRVELLAVYDVEGTEHLDALASRLPGLRAVSLGSRYGYSFPVSGFQPVFPDVEVSLAPR
ncbi:hypothetical protein [Streptomyces sp. NPDC048392]|uniref:hypothetical protein n=1 Tax=Streptomyces sp. NPDC048392 TaxID=3365543 RepID=UPI00370FA71E